MCCAKGDMGDVEVSDHAVLHGWVGGVGGWELWVGGCVCVCVCVVLTV